MRPLETGPDFFCVGLQVAGTAWLFDQLDFHEDFWMPPIKEIHYFDEGLKNKHLAHLHRTAHEKLGELNSNRIKKERRSLDERDINFMDKAVALKGTRMNFERYADLFCDKGGKMSGDITPGYSTLSEPAIEEIVSHFPAAKVLLLVRDPIERNWSQMNMHIRNNKIAAEAATDWSQIEGAVRSKGPAARSYPTDVWRRWSNIVHKERMRYFFFDDIIDKPEQIRGEIISYIGGDPRKPSGSLPAGYNRKANRPKVPMSEAVRAGMVDLFREELLACAQIFGGRARDWPARYGLT